jgi:hypothetical protein
MHTVKPIIMIGERMKQHFSFSSRLSIAAAVLVATAGVSACSDDSTSPGGGTPGAVAISAAPATTSQVAVAIPGPAVLVTGEGGAPLPGVIVKFTVQGGGAVQYPIATTDANGIASAGLWQIGPKVGSNIVTATVEGLAPVTFTVASQAGPAAAIGTFSGNAQSGAPGSALANPLVVRITDAGGNPKSGATVTFTVTSGGGSLSTTTATTNAAGLATSGTWTLGAGQCGQTVRATSGTLVVDFSASSRGTISVDGSASGTLAAGDCVIDGKFADEYDMTTAAGAINVSISAGFGGLAQAVTSDGSSLIASGNVFRLLTASSSKAIRATSETAGATGAYTVSVASASSDVNGCEPVYIELGASTNQTLSASDCQDPYFGVSGDPYLVYVPAGVAFKVSQTSSTLDSEFAVFSPTGTLLVDRDTGGSETFTLTAATSGFYKIVSSSYCLVFDDVYAAGCDLSGYKLTVERP